MHPSASRANDFHLYGNSTPELSVGTADNCQITVSLVRKVAHEQYGCTITSHGGEIRRALFDSCPARCDQGLLQDQDAQHSLLADSVPRIHEDYRPLCPVYIGFRLSMRFAELRYTRETSHVQINAVSDFYSDLNHRRQHLQYEPESLEFDMSQWELPSREEWEGWQTWEKALDPNADPVFHCASDNAIAVLRRTPYAKIDKSEAMENCAICGSEWDESSVLVELPCAHSYCECIEQWLKTSNACPECRAPLLEVETKDGVMVESNENVEQTTEQAEMEAVTTSKEDGNGLDVEEDGGPSASITAGEE